MPIFQYDTYRNPYGPSIAEALAHQADPQAAAALRSGDIEARAAQQQGALRAQQFSTLGAIPGEIQAERDRALVRQRAAQQQQIAVQQLQQGALSLEDAQAQRAADLELGKRFAATPRGSDGTLDMRAFLGSVPPELTKYAQKWIAQGNGMNESWIADDARRRGQMQQAAQTLVQAGAPFQATLGLIESAHRDRVLTDEQAAQYKNDVIEDPQGAAGVLKRLTGPPQIKFIGADQRGIDAAGNVVVPAQGKPGEGEYTLGDQRFNAQHQPVGPKATPPLTGDLQVAALMGQEAAGQPLSASDKALVEGWKAKEGLKPFTVKTVVNGREVEQVMTTADAIKQGWFAVPPQKGTPGESQKIADIKLAVQGMKNGTQAPILPGRGTDAYIALVGEAERQGFDMARAATDWQATQRYLASANAAPQLKLRQSINALPAMLDKVESLAKEWDGGQFPVLNRANLSAAKNGVYGDAAASIARRLEAQIADVTSDLGAVYMGGNSPTDEALQLAQKALAGDWSKPVLLDSIGLARENVRTRSNSIRTTGVAGASDENPYDRANRTPIQEPAATGAAPAPPTMGEVRSQGGERRMWDGGGWVRVK